MISFVVLFAEYFDLRLVLKGNVCLTQQQNLTMMTIELKGII